MLLTFYFFKLIFVFNLELKNRFFVKLIHQINGDWGLGIGDWGLGIGDWGLGPIPNPQSPIPNPQSPFDELISQKNDFLILN
jgi:hypothetical protein